MFNPMANNSGIPVFSIVENNEAFVFGDGENKNNDRFTLNKFYKYIESLILNDTQYCLNKNIKNIINKIKDERHIISNIPAKCLHRYHYERPVEIYREYVKSNENFDHSMCKHDKINNNPIILELLNRLKNNIIDNNYVQQPQEYKPEKTDFERIFGYYSKKNKTTDFGKMNTSEPVKQTGGVEGSSGPFGIPMHSALFGVKASQAPQAPQGSSNPFGAPVPSVPQAPQAPQVPPVPQAPTGFTGFKFPEPPAKARDPQSVQDSREQRDGSINLDAITSLTLNYNLDYAVRGIGSYHMFGILEGLQGAIQYLNDELENPNSSARVHSFIGRAVPHPQQGGLLNLDTIAALKLNSNLDHAIKAIVAYRITGSFDSLKKAIQYLNNELEKQ